MEEINGRKVRVDKKAWEKEQGRQMQRDLLASLKERAGTGMVPPPGFTGGPGGLEAYSMPLGRRRSLARTNQSSSLT